MEWIEIDAELPEVARDAFANRLFELGAEGVDEGEITRIKGFFSRSLETDAVAGAKAFFSALKNLHPSSAFGELQVRSIADSNWADEYKKYYTAQPFSRSFYLLPAWEKPSAVPEGKQAILMEPGRAFGTGIHPSTQLCASLFEQALERLPAPEGLRLLDLGTGTGILAIVAHKLGVKDIVAIDNDPEAVEVAAENFGINGSTGIDLSVRDVAGEKTPFDVMLCNILLETHLELAPVYGRLLAQNGVLIVSGLLGHQRHDMDACFAAIGLRPDTSASLQEWTSVAYVRA